MSMRATKTALSLALWSLWAVLPWYIYFPLVITFIIYNGWYTILFRLGKHPWQIGAEREKTEQWKEFLDQPTYVDPRQHGLDKYGYHVEDKFEVNEPDEDLDFMLGKKK